MQSVWSFVVFLDCPAPELALGVMPPCRHLYGCHLFTFSTQKTAKEKGRFAILSVVA